ncbi:MAG: hypothetical protein ACR2HO_06600 [Rubrobacteraceae bacterium]|nr:hypothetical protein [Rubrobacter sp.]
MGPLRTGFRYGVVAVLVALAADLRFLFVSPTGTPNWILTAIEEYRTSLALAAYIFLGILAALRMRPDRMEQGVPYRALLLRDGALAATVGAVMVGATLFVVTFLNATVFSDTIRDYAHAAAPSIVAYNEKVANRLNDPPPVPGAAEIEQGLQPPKLRDLGRSIANFVMRALLMGTAGAIVGLLRGRAGPDRDGRTPDPPYAKTSEPR